MTRNQLPAALCGALFAVRRESIRRWLISRCHVGFGFLLLGGTAPLAQAGLADARGIWQLDGDFTTTTPGATSLDASSLTLGSDYAFGSEFFFGIPGYSFLQTQLWTPNTKRLTVTNPVGSNGRLTLIGGPPRPTRTTGVS